MRDSRFKTLRLPVTFHSADKSGELLVAAGDAPLQALVRNLASAAVPAYISYELEPTLVQYIGSVIDGVYTLRGLRADLFVLMPGQHLYGMSDPAGLHDQFLSVATWEALPIKPVRRGPMSDATAHTYTVPGSSDDPIPIVKVGPNPVRVVVRNNSGGGIPISFSFEQEALDVVSPGLGYSATYNLPDQQSDTFIMAPGQSLFCKCFSPSGLVSVVKSEMP